MGVMDGEGALCFKRDGDDAVVEFSISVGDGCCGRRMHGGEGASAGGKGAGDHGSEIGFGPVKGTRFLIWVLVEVSSWFSFGEMPTGCVFPETKGFTS